MKRLLFITIIVLAIAIGGYNVGNIILKNFGYVTKSGEKVEFYYNNALEAINREDYEKARDILEIAIEIDAKNKKLNILLGDVYLKLNEPIVAITQYENAFSPPNDITQDDIEKVFLLTKLYLKNKKLKKEIEFKDRIKKALTYYKKILNLLPMNERALLGLSICYIKLEEFKEAKKYLEKIINNGKDYKYVESAKEILRQLK